MQGNLFRIEKGNLAYVHYRVKDDGRSARDRRCFSCGSNGGGRITRLAAGLDFIIGEGEGICR